MKSMKTGSDNENQERNAVERPVVRRIGPVATATPTFPAVINVPAFIEPELSALEASLATLEPQVSPGGCEAVKLKALIKLFETTPPLTGEKLIDTIVKTGDQEITLSLREYVKSARLVAGLYGSAIGVLLGLLLGIGLMLLIDMRIKTMEAGSAATRSDRSLDVLDRSLRLSPTLPAFMDLPAFINVPAFINP